MAKSLFKTNPVLLRELLADCEKGKLQLPDFQRSWVWDEERIRSLIASVSRAFPVGALMTLETGGGIEFKPRPVEGAPSEASSETPSSLLLDGQQRMTSLYQVTLRKQVVSTVTPKKKKVKRWFYIDIMKALDPLVDREDAIFGVPEDRVIRSDFGRKIELDLSSRELEFESLMYPVSMLFDFQVWQQDYITHFLGRQDELQKKWSLLNEFQEQIIQNFTSYQVPVIALDRDTSKEAVCVVFEKVNTGGKPLDAFELITAMYAAEGYELRKDWYGEGSEMGRHARLARTHRLADAKSGILADVSNTDFLHVVSLFHTREKRREAEAMGKSGKELPQVIGNRQALLNLPLSAYVKYQDKVESGFVAAAKFLHRLHIYRIFDLPYQSQIIPLAAILADIGDDIDHEANREKLTRWYWNGVFGELYGSTTETRIAKDFIEVPLWMSGGSEPTTVADASFRSERLKTMRMRLSAAYKGVNALLMLEGAKDFRSGQRFDHTVFFGENVDIHHIFPKKWCESRGIHRSVYDSIINKTPLSFRTNRMIGGEAPSIYIAGLEKGKKSEPPIGPANLDSYLSSHLIDPRLLREDDFEAFLADRQLKLVALIEEAIGKTVPTEDVDVSTSSKYQVGEEFEAEFGVDDDDALVDADEARLTLSELRLSAS